MHARLILHERRRRAQQPPARVVQVVPHQRVAEGGEVPAQLVAPACMGVGTRTPRAAAYLRGARGFSLQPPPPPLRAAGAKVALGGSS